METPKISVIIPLYNKRDYIKRAIMSVLAQDYVNLEVVVVDDGSEDDGSQVVQSLNYDRIFYFRKENGGVSSSRNMGVENSSGTWILFLDADDYLLPGSISALYRTAVQYGTKLATGNYFLEREGVRTSVCSSLNSFKAANNYKSIYFKCCSPCPGNLLIHRSVFNLHRFDERLSRYEDSEFLLNVLRGNEISYTPEFVMVYVQDTCFASRVYRWPERDFIMHLVFENKTFWEKMILAELLNEGLSLYGDEIIRGKYEKYFNYLYCHCKIRRFKSWRKKVFDLIMRSKSICTRK